METRSKVEIYNLSVFILWLATAIKMPLKLKAIYYLCFKFLIGLYKISALDIYGFLFRSFQQRLCLVRYYIMPFVIYLYINQNPLGFIICASIEYIFVSLLFFVGFQWQRHWTIFVIYLNFKFKIRQARYMRKHKLYKNL